MIHGDVVAYTRFRGEVGIHYVARLGKVTCSKVVAARVTGTGCLRIDAIPWLLLKKLEGGGRQFQLRALSSW